MSKSTYYLFLAAAFLAFTICFRVSGWLSMLRGSDEPSVIIREVELGDLLPGTVHSFDAILENATSRTLQIVGEQTCCGMKIHSLPKEVAAYASVPIHATVSVPQGQSKLEWEAVVYVNNGSLIPIGFVVVGSMRDVDLITDAPVDFGESVLTKQ